MNQYISHFLVSRFDDPAKSWSGYVHFFRCLFLVEPFKIRQANRFEFVHGQYNFFQTRGGNSPWLKVCAARQAIYLSGAFGSDHV
jgi:hypothetical protein